MAQRRPPKSKKRRPSPPLQKMGGKEERVSKVGAARARVEKQEERGVPRFDEAPGPSTDQLLQPAKGRRKARPNQRVSRMRRAGPSELEPENRTSTDKSGDLNAKLARQPKDQLPSEE